MDKIDMVIARRIHGKQPTLLDKRLKWIDRQKKKFNTYIEAFNNQTLIKDNNNE